MNVVAFALFAVLLASVSAQNCQYTDATSGCTYDLSSLALPLSSVSFYTHNQTEGTGAGFYEANICAPLNGSVANDVEGLAVSQSVGTTSYSCGTFASQTFAPYSGLVKDNTLTCQGVQVVYTGGDNCKALGVDRSTVINVGCDATAATEIADVTEGDSCDYTIQMWSAAACGAAAATETPSTTISVLVDVTESSTPTVSAAESVAATESATPTVSAAESAASESVGASASVAASESVAATESAVATETESIAPTQSAVEPDSTTPTASLSVGASPSTTGTATASLSVGASPSTTPSLSVGASSGNGSNAWIWWVVGAVAIVLIVIAVGVAGFVVYRKKQQSYDSIGYE